MSCNLELGLLPSPSSTSSTFSMGSNGESPKQDQMMTIFYNGRICVCEVTELQARSIINLANRKAAEATRKSPASREDAVSAAPQFQQIRPKTDLPMKRSLRQFLEKRKCRIQATAPYHL